jgi:hypothetical protein
MKMAVFWVVAPCSLIEVYQRFRGPCCLHHQGPATTQKTAIFKITLSTYINSIVIITEMYFVRGAVPTCHSKELYHCVGPLKTRSLNDYSIEM